MVVLISLRSGEVYTEELIEIPVLSGILALVHVIAGQRKRAEEALRDANQELENRVAERTIALTRLNEELLQEIIERQRTEATLRKSEEELRKLSRAVEQSPSVVIITDTEGNIEYVNPKFTQITGYTPEEVIGKPPRLLRSGETPPEEYEQLWKVIASGGDWHGEFHNRKKNGELYWVSVSISPIRDSKGNITHFLSVQEDITERKQVEVQLERSNRELLSLSKAERNQRQLAEALVQAVMALNTSLNLDEVLDRILEQTQRVIPCRATNVMLVEGETIYIARHRGFEGLAEVRDSVETDFPLDSFPLLKAMSLSSRPIVIVDTHSEPGWGGAPGFEWVRSYAAAPLQTGSQTIGFLNIFSEQPGFFSQEIADRLNAFAAHAVLAIQNARLYQELENLLEHEQAMRDQLVQAEKLTAMGRMVASVAHELNNPLQTVKNCLFLAQQEVTPDAPIYEFLDISSSEIQRLSNLVAQLREVYRPRTADAMQPLELSKILEEIHILVTPHLQRHRVQWEQPLAESTFIVKGIADQLKQVFLNISLNAIEAMQSSGGTLFVDLIADPDSGQVGVVFRDTGPGISPEDMSRLFEPFFTTKKAGTGLGLSISYDIVRAHGGLIAVDSRPGAGTTFTVWLPLAIKEERIPPARFQGLKVKTAVTAHLPANSKRYPQNRDSESTKA